MTDPVRVLVTGATGFAGSHLVRRLVHEAWDVHVISRVAGSIAASPAFEEVRERLTVHELATTQSEAYEVVRSVEPRVIFHLAASGGYDHKPADIEQLVAVNVRLGTDLLEGLRATGGGLFVWAATSWQHYQGATYSPVSLYAATKQAFADILTYYNEACGVRSVTLTLSDTYGPHDRRRKLLAQLKEALTSGTEVRLSPGDQLVDYVYIDDVIEAFMIAADLLLTGSEGGTFAVSSGAYHSVQDLVAAYSLAVGKEIPASFGGRSYRDREMMEPWTGDVCLPGWRPHVGLAEGLNRLAGSGE